MMMTTGPIPDAIQRRDVVDFAVTALGRATGSRAPVLGSSFRSRTRKSPDVFALPCSTARIRAPRAATFASDQFVAPVTSTNFASPLRKHTRDSLRNKWWQLQFVNSVFRWCAFCGHVCSQTITLTKQSVDTVEILAN
jgi:hypothetical protein